MKKIIFTIINMMLALTFIFTGCAKETNTATPITIIETTQSETEAIQIETTVKEKVAITVIPEEIATTTVETTIERETTTIPIIEQEPLVVVEEEIPVIWEEEEIINETTTIEETEEEIIQFEEFQTYGEEVETETVYEQPEQVYQEEEDYYYSGSVLTPAAGINYYNGILETYYNLPMGGVLDIMYALGYSGEYWVRSDGVKMFGDYIMVAADFGWMPRGSIVETSLGTGIVCDTGAGGWYWFDIAVTW